MLRKRCLHFKQILFIFCQITDICGAFFPSSSFCLGSFKNLFPILQLSARLMGRINFSIKERSVSKSPKREPYKRFPTFQYELFPLTFLKQAEPKPSLFGSQSENKRIWISLTTEKGLFWGTQAHHSRLMCVILHCGYKHI